jgi:hypothetical protein
MRREHSELTTWASHGITIRSCDSRAAAITKATPMVTDQRYQNQYDHAIVAVTSATRCQQARELLASTITAIPTIAFKLLNLCDSVARLPQEPARSARSLVPT